MVNSYVFYVDKLKGNYKDTFKKIEMYVSEKNLDEKSKEEMLSGLIDIFLNAQDEEKPVEKITGKNLERFCKEFCSGYGIKSHIINIFESTFIMMIVLSIISALDLINIIEEITFNDKFNFWTYTNSINIIAYLLGISIVLVTNYIAGFIIKKIMFKRKRITMFANMAIKLFICILAVIVSVLLYNIAFPPIPVWVVLFIIFVYFIAYMLITKDNRKIKKENHISFWELTNTSKPKMETEYIEKRRFYIMNRKREKKGLKALTHEEFLNLEEKNCNRWDRKPALYFILPPLICILATILVHFTDGFDSTADIFIFFGINLILSSIISMFFWKMEKSITTARLKWIKKEKANSTSWDI